MKIVVIGGTGLIGSKTIPILRQGGHEVVAASPKGGVNTITGEGLKEAMAGAQVVIDLSNARSFDPEVALEFFGPERVPLNEMVSGYLKAVGDSREVVRDPEGRYFGGRVEAKFTRAIGRGASRPPQSRGVVTPLAEGA